MRTYSDSSPDSSFENSIQAPEIFIQPPDEVGQIFIEAAFKIVCDSIYCNWYEYCDEVDVAIEHQRQHAEWHSEGCPE